MQEQVTEIDLLQAISQSQASLVEQNQLIIEMLSVLIPQPSEGESAEPTLKEMVLMVLEQNQKILSILTHE